jgi:hypothetical protein
LILPAIFCFIFSRGESCDWAVAHAAPASTSEHAVKHAKTRTGTELPHWRDDMISSCHAKQESKGGD